MQLCNCLFRPSLQQGAPAVRMCGVQRGEAGLCVVVPAGQPPPKPVRPAAAARPDAAGEEAGLHISRMARQTGPTAPRVSKREEKGTCAVSLALVTVTSIAFSI